MSKQLDLIVQTAQPILKAHQAELVDAEYLKEGQNRVFRLYVELLNGRITLDDCAIINRELSDKLDTIDSDDDRYILEISSPGVNRKLKTEKDFIRFIGSKVDVSLYESMNGNKKFTAELSDYKDGTVYFLVEDEVIAAPIEKIGKVNLHFEY